MAEFPENASDIRKSGAVMRSRRREFQRKADGLVKRAISLIVDGIKMHLVSYYRNADIDAGLLAKPSETPALSAIPIRKELNQIKLRAEPQIFPTSSFERHGHGIKGLNAVNPHKRGFRYPSDWDSLMASSAPAPGVSHKSKSPIPQMNFTAAKLIAREKASPNNPMAEPHETHFPASSHITLLMLSDLASTMPKLSHP